MSVLVQISDPHFGTEQPLVVLALLELIQREKPDVAVLSGDITQRARRGEFAEAKRFVDGLDVPRTLVIPGNHDIPLFNPFARLFHPYANFCRAFGEELEPEHDSESLLVVCVNTTRRQRHVDGEVSDAQIERISARLRQAKAAQLRIVVTHQPVHGSRPYPGRAHSRAVRGSAPVGAGTRGWLGGASWHGPVEPGAGWHPEFHQSDPAHYGRWCALCYRTLGLFSVGAGIPLCRPFLRELGALARKLRSGLCLLKWTSTHSSSRLRC